MLRDITTVSYTHLDVYKRQVDGISLEDVAGAFADTQASQGSSQAIAALVSQMCIRDRRLALPHL